MKQKTDQSILDKELFSIYDSVAQAKIDTKTGCELLETLIEQSANVNAKDDEKIGLLFGGKIFSKKTTIWGERVISPEITELLIIKGVKINIFDKRGDHLLHKLAAQAFSNDISRILTLLNPLNPNYSNHAKESPLHIAAACHNHLFIDFLNENIKTNVNNQNTFGNTPLHLTVMSWAQKSQLGIADQEQTIATIKALFKNHKIDPNIMNDDNRTALNLARKYERSQHIDKDASVIGNFIEEQIRLKGIPLNGQYQYDSKEESGKRSSPCCHFVKNASNVASKCIIM